MHGSARVYFEARQEQTFKDAVLKLRLLGPDVGLRRLDVEGVPVVGVYGPREAPEEEVEGREVVGDNRAWDELAALGPLANGYEGFFLLNMWSPPRSTRDAKRVEAGRE